ncbi:hypothetical protein M9H77_08721 [Catharanthus roseus]|uniref:Uncharacterized protein n=1 Tax=Catharanthus roseus TaxID=4058 RepID=A0ACC0BYZ5_CATRO|nr:hypothetical protein M9H77_08721 [Catharanthus roseus]
MESSVGEKTTKVDELSQVQDRRTTHNEKKHLHLCKGCQSYTMNPSSPQQVHEEQGKMREKDRVECEMKKNSISEDKRIEGQDVSEENKERKKLTVTRTRVIKRKRVLWKSVNVRRVL